MQMAQKVLGKTGNSKFKRIESLTQTSFSEIFKCETKEGRFCASKVMKSSTYPDFQKEKEMVKKISEEHHPNIVQFLGYSESDDKITIEIFMELCEGDVFQLICPHPNERLISCSLPPVEMCKQAMTGIDRLHNFYNIIHRDIKPSNFLIKDSTIKIADFGLSRMVGAGQSRVATMSPSTESYMAPEYHQAGRQRSSKDWKKEGDIFALGIVFYFILTSGKHPFGEGDVDQAYCIKNKKTPDLSSLKDSDELTEEEKVAAHSLIKHMIEFNPTKRFTIAQVKGHPLFWSFGKKKKFYLEKVIPYLKTSEGKETFSKVLNGVDVGSLTVEESEEMTIVQEMKNLKLDDIKSCFGIKEEEEWDWEKFKNAVLGSHCYLRMFIYQLLRGKFEDDEKTYYPDKLPVIPADTVDNLPSWNLEITESNQRISEEPELEDNQASPNPAGYGAISREIRAMPRINSDKSAKQKSEKYQFDMESIRDKLKDSMQAGDLYEMLRGFPISENFISDLKQKRVTLGTREIIVEGFEELITLGEERFNPTKLVEVFQKLGKGLYVALVEEHCKLSGIDCSYEK